MLLWELTFAFFLGWVDTGSNRCAPLEPYSAAEALDRFDLVGDIDDLCDEVLWLRSDADTALDLVALLKVLCDAILLSKEVLQISLPLG